MVRDDRPDPHDKSPGMSGANASPTRSASAIARSLKIGRSHQETKVSSVIAAVQGNVRNHGLQAAVYDVVVRSINRFVYLKTLECIVIERLDPGVAILPAHLDCVRLDGARLSSFSRVKENELPEEFV